MALTEAKEAIVAALIAEGLDMDAVRRVSPLLAKFGAAIAGEERSKAEQRIASARVQALADATRKAEATEAARRIADPFGLKGMYGKGAR